jgi:hypothetical protein
MSRPVLGGIYTPAEVKTFTEGGPLTVSGMCPYCEHALYLQFRHRCGPTNARTGLPVGVARFKCPDCGFWLQIYEEQLARAGQRITCPCTGCRTFLERIP